MKPFVFLTFPITHNTFESTLPHVKTNPEHSRTEVWCLIQDSMVEIRTNIRSSESDAWGSFVLVWVMFLRSLDSLKMRPKCPIFVANLQRVLWKRWHCALLSWFKLCLENFTKLWTTFVRNWILLRSHFYVSSVLWILQCAR